MLWTWLTTVGVLASGIGLIGTLIRSDGSHMRVTMAILEFGALTLLVGDLGSGGVL